MEGNSILKCQNCGAVLEVQLNEGIQVCTYCGSRNLVGSQQMKAETSVGGMKVSGNTDSESIISSIEYAISSGNYKKADELILFALMSGKDDYRIHIEKCKLDMLFRRDKQLFETLRKIRKAVGKDISPQEAEDLATIMKYRDEDGMTVLHVAAYHLYYDMVKFCVEAGSEVRAVAGPNSVTPITIMYTDVSPDVLRYDGASLTHSTKQGEEIKNYLLSKGAPNPSFNDTRRAKSWQYNRRASNSGVEYSGGETFGRSSQGRSFGYKYAADAQKGKVVDKITYCLLALFLGSFGVQKFYSGQIAKGIACILFYWTWIPGIIGIVDAIKGFRMEEVSNGKIYITK